MQPASSAERAARALERAMSATEPVFRTIAGIGVVVLMLLTVADIVSRSTVNRSIPGVIEITEVTLVAVVFLGMQTSIRDAQNIRVTLLTDRLPPALARSSRILASLLSIAIIGWMIYATTLKAIASVQAGEYRFGLIPIPLWPARIAVPLGLTALLLVLLLQLFSLIARRAQIVGMQADEFTKVAMPTTTSTHAAPEPRPTNEGSGL